MQHLSTTDVSWVRPHLPVSESERAEAKLTVEDMVGAGGVYLENDIYLICLPYYFPTSPLLHLRIFKIANLFRL